MVTVKMAKVGTKVGNKRWKADSRDGKLLDMLVKSKKISAGMTPGALKDLYPQFNVYKNDAFASALRRLKLKHGTNVRGDSSGKNVLFCWLCFKLRFFESLFVVVVFSTDSNEESENEDMDDILGSVKADDEEDGMDGTASVSGSGSRGARTVGAPSLSGQHLGEQAQGVWVPFGLKAVHEDTSLVTHQVLLTLLPAGVGHQASDDIEVNLEKIGNGYVFGDSCQVAIICVRRKVSSDA
jgi:hypothetical protein